MARQTAEQRKRSEAAKKAAETRKKNQEEEEKARQAEASGEQPEQVEGAEEIRRLTPEELAQREHVLRVAHNARTGGGEVHEGELQAAHDEHNRRTAGINV